MKNNKTFYVEVYHDYYAGPGFEVHPANDFRVDSLNTGMIAVWVVDYCNKKEDAITAVLMKMAGKDTAVTLAYGGKNGN